MLADDGIVTSKFKDAIIQYNVSYLKLQDEKQNKKLNHMDITCLRALLDEIRNFPYNEEPGWYAQNKEKLNKEITKFNKLYPEDNLPLLPSDIPLITNPQQNPNTPPQSNTPRKKSWLITVGIGVALALASYYYLTKSDPVRPRKGAASGGDGADLLLKLWEKLISGQKFFVAGTSIGGFGYYGYNKVNEYYSMQLQNVLEKARGFIVEKKYKEAYDLLKANESLDKSLTKYAEYAQTLFALNEISKVQTFESDAEQPTSQLSSTPQ